PASKRYSQFYLRLHVKDELGAFATISELFNQEGISFERILQTPAKQGFAEIIVVTHKASLANFKTALSKLDELNVVDNVENYLRVEGDDETMTWQGIMKTYKAFLTVTDETPDISLYEGNTPLLPFPHI